MDRRIVWRSFCFVVVTLGNRGGIRGRSKWYSHVWLMEISRIMAWDDKKAAVEQLIDRHDLLTNLKLEFMAGQLRLEDLCLLLCNVGLSGFLQMAVIQCRKSRKQTFYKTAGESEKHHWSRGANFLQKRHYHFCLSDRKNPRSGKESKRSFMLSHVTGIIMYICNNSIRMANA